MTSALDDTWSDCLESYRAEISSMKLWDNVILHAADRELLLSSPEVMDPKTDSSYGWKTDGSISGFFASKALTDVTSLTSSQVLDVMDTLLAKESLYFRGRSVLQSIASFVYMVRLHELKAKHPVLHAYARGVLRTLNLVIRLLTATGIREEEEFAGVPVEIDTEVAEGEVIAELDAAILASAASEEIKARLMFRKQLVQVLSSVFAAVDKSSITSIVEQCRKGIEALSATTFQRPTEPIVDAGLFRDVEISRWLTTVVPVPTRPTPPFAEAVKCFVTMLTHIASIEQVYATRSIQAVHDFVESFSLKQPLLPTRCAVLILLFGENPNVTFLFGPSIHQLLLETVANVYGAPIYAKVIEGNEATLNSLVLYSGNRSQQALFRRNAVEGLQSWVVRTTRILLQFWESMLCTRGRAHRRLANMLEELSHLQLHSQELDVTIFTAAKPGAIEVQRGTERDMIERTMVLTAVVCDLTYHVQSVMLQTMLELDVFTRAELTAVMYWLHGINTMRLDNLNTLFLGSTQFVPEKRPASRTGVPHINPALSSRFATAAPAALLTRLDANRHLADVAFRTLSALEAKGLLDLSPPKHSLVPVSQIFNNRMIASLRGRAFPFTPFEQIAVHQESVAKMGFDEVTSIVVPMAKQISDKVKVFATQLAAAGSVGAKEYFAAVEKTARAIHVSMNLLRTLEPAALANFDVVVDFPAHPGLLAVALKRKLSA